MNHEIIFVIFLELHKIPLTRETSMRNTWKITLIIGERKRCRKIVEELEKRISEMSQSFSQIF